MNAGTLRTLGVLLLLTAMPALAHTIAGSDASFVQGIDRPAIMPFLYLGAKHMVTGYDHLLFLAGVIFFLYHTRHVVQYVSVFALGHSITLLLGVLADWQVNAYLIDAIIGLSIVYKALDNLGAFARVSWMPDPRVAVFAFGLCHGLGLATKLQAFELSANGLVANLLSFNVGVELGQLLALSVILIVIQAWRRQPGFLTHAFATNTVLMGCGFLLAGYQLAGWVLMPPGVVP